MKNTSWKKRYNAAERATGRANEIATRNKQLATGGRGTGWTVSKSDPAALTDHPSHMGGSRCIATEQLNADDPPTE